MGLKQWEDKEAAGGVSGGLYLVWGGFYLVWGAFGAVCLRRGVLLIPAWMGDKFEKS